MAHKYTLTFPEHIRVFNLSDGRQAYPEAPGLLTTDDRRLALLIQGEYTRHVELNVDEDGAATADDEWVEDAPATITETVEVPVTPDVVVTEKVEETKTKPAHKK